MFSISKKGPMLAVQLVFLVLNGLGLFLGTIYNASTPDLYPNNAHHPLGWVLTWIACAQICLALIAKLTPSNAEYTEKGEDVAFMPVAMDDGAHSQWKEHNADYRFSNDSGHGTERNSASLRSGSSSSLDKTGEDEGHDTNSPYSDSEENFDKINLMDVQRTTKKGRIGAAVSMILEKHASRRVLKVCAVIEQILARTILVLGFVGITTGIVTYGGFFVCSMVSCCKS
jgi:hypothetical protein